MSNRNKRGLRKFATKQVKKMSDQSSNSTSKSLRETRSSGAKSDMDKKKSVQNKNARKSTNDVAESQDLLFLKNEFLKQLTEIRNEVKANQEGADKNLLDLLDHQKKKYQELKNNKNEKKNTIAKLEVEIEEYKKLVERKNQEMETLTKMQENSLRIIKSDNEKKMDEISALQQSTVKLTTEVEKLRKELDVKILEHSTVLETTKKNYDTEIVKLKEKNEESMAQFVSKAEYNSLVDDYEKLKRAYEDNERKLNKTIADKKMVEKGKLDVIRQKEQQKDEIMDFITTFNREVKPLLLGNRTGYSNFGNRNFSSSGTDNFPKRLRRY